MVCKTSLLQRLKTLSVAGQMWILSSTHQSFGLVQVCYLVGALPDVRNHSMIQGAWLLDTHVVFTETDSLMLLDGHNCSLCEHSTSVLSLAAISLCSVFSQRDPGTSFSMQCDIPQSSVLLVYVTRCRPACKSELSLTPMAHTDICGTSGRVCSAWTDSAEHSMVTGKECSF